jgi:hypothetical protein
MLRQTTVAVLPRDVAVNICDDAAGLLSTARPARHGVFLARSERRATTEEVHKHGVVGGAHRRAVAETA